MEQPKRQGLTRRDVLKGMGALAAAAALKSDTMDNMALEGTLEKRSEKVDVPQRRFFTDALTKSLVEAGTEPTKQLEMQRALDELIDTYIDQNLEHTELFTSKETGAVFPYARLNSAEFAKKVYRKFRGEPAITEDSNDQRRHKEFIFSPIFTTDDGSGFSVWEEQFRELTMRLPEALQALEEGREPEQYEVYSMGAPTNGAGIVTPEFANGVKEHGALRTFAELQSELIAREIEGTPEQRGNTDVYFWGLSMGGSLSVLAAEKLLAEGKVTQISREEARKALERENVPPEERARMEEALRLPHLAVRADLSPGINDFVSRARTFRGWAGTAVQDLLTPYMRAFMMSNATFQKNVAAELHRRHPDIQLHMDKDQAAIKNGLIWPGTLDSVAGLAGMLDTSSEKSTLIGDVFSGSPLPDTLKVTQVFGADDPYMKAIRAEMDQTLERFRDPAQDHVLGGNIMPSSAPGNRQFTADTRHFMPWLRPTELHKMARATEAVVRLKQ